MRLGDRLLLLFAPPLAALIIRILYGLNRIDYVGEEHPRSFWEKGERLIMPIWHDQLLMMVKGYPGPGSIALISASKDGELISRVVRYFGHQAVRGSSSRGGGAAFRELVRLAKQDRDLLITPDGPTGPRHELKDGVVQLARLSGRSVVPMAFACSRGYRFRSWDRFLLPYPFGRGVFSFGAPVCYHRGETIEDFRQRLLDAMALTQQQALEHLEEYGVSAV